MTERTATATWNGNLLHGSGSFDVGSGAIPTQPVTWAARTEEPNGKTSPEELIAAAHASCYSMALSHTLASNHTPAETLVVTATVGFSDKPGGGKQVSHSNLSVEGIVPGLTQDQFADLAAQGEASCPVSNALRGNVEINLVAHLKITT